MKRCVSRPPVGFTLVELLVVIAIIGLLVTILVPAVQTARRQAEVSKTAARINELAAACDRYFIDTGYYPGQDEPHQLTGHTPPGTYTGSQYLAKVLVAQGEVQFDSDDFLGPPLPADGYQLPPAMPADTISDRTSKEMPILYFPARRPETGLKQFKYGDNSIYFASDPSHPRYLNETLFKIYIRNKALDETPSSVDDDDLPFGDGKFIIVGPSYKGKYFAGGPTYPNL